MLLRPKNNIILIAVSFEMAGLRREVYLQHKQNLQNQDRYKNKMAQAGGLVQYTAPKN